MLSEATQEDKDKPQLLNTCLSQEVGTASAIRFLSLHSAAWINKEPVELCLEIVATLNTHISWLDTLEKTCKSSS